MEMTWLAIQRTLLLLLGTLGLVDVAWGRQTRGGGDRVPVCSEVHSRCFARDGCKFAMENYFLQCLDISEDSTYSCTPRCKMALVMLLSSEEHDGPQAFRDCDCEDEDFCLQQKERMSVCQDDVQHLLDAIHDPDEAISCSMATMVCSADSMCLMAIEYYENHCKRLQDPTNPRCNSRCNNSLDILYRQEKAQKLQTCYCDGTEAYNCSQLKRNTQDLCFNLRRHHSGHDHTRRPHRPHQPREPQPTPPETNLVDNSIIDKDYQVQEGASIHNSAYTIHNSAGISRWVPQRQCLWYSLVVYLVTQLIHSR